MNNNRFTRYISLAASLSLVFVLLSPHLTATAKDRSMIDDIEPVKIDVPTNNIYTMAVYIQHMFDHETKPIELLMPLTKGLDKVRPAYNLGEIRSDLEKSIDEIRQLFSPEDFTDCKIRIKDRTENMGLKFIDIDGNVTNRKIYQEQKDEYVKKLRLKYGFSTYLSKSFDSDSFEQRRKIEQIERQIEKEADIAFPGLTELVSTYYDVRIYVTDEYYLNFLAFTYANQLVFYPFNTTLKPFKIKAYD